MRVSSDSVIQAFGRVGAPLAEAVLTVPVTNESGAMPKLAVCVLITKDTLRFCSYVPPTFSPSTQPPSAVCPSNIQPSLVFRFVL